MYKQERQSQQRTKMILKCPVPRFFVLYLEFGGGLIENSVHGGEESLKGQCGHEACMHADMRVHL